MIVNAMLTGIVLLRRCASVVKRRERIAVDVPHDEKQSACVLDEIQHRRDVAVMDVGNDVRFVAQHRNEAGVVAERWLHALDRNDAPEPARPHDVADANFAHPATRDDCAERISPRHACVHAGADPEIEDLGGRNGTKIAGRTLAVGERCKIRGGDILQFGDVPCFVQHEANATIHVSASGGSTAERPSPKSEAGVVVAKSQLSQIYETVSIFATTPLPVLILGETGVGKDVLARSIHGASLRSTQRFTRLNCAALPETLLEAELFGYERGAFTGAVAAKAGLFEASDGGTVFLDEIGDVPLTTQVKLLVVLETGDVTRIGSVRPKHVDVRFISATNHDLVADVREGRFRADLYFRLNGVTVTIPPLRERRDEVQALASYLLDEASKRLGVAPARLDASARAKLDAHDSPGNVRELKSVLERAVAYARGGTVTGEHVLFDRLTMAPATEVPSSAQASATSPALTRGSEGGLRATMAVAEREQILQALSASAGNQSRAAKLLGISRATLVRRLGEYDLPRPKK